MKPEKILAEKIFSLTESVYKMNIGSMEMLNTDTAATQIGRLMLEGRKHDMIKLLFQLSAIYLDILEKETRHRLISNKQTYLEIEESC